MQLLSVSLSHIFKNEPFFSSSADYIEKRLVIHSVLSISEYTLWEQRVLWLWCYGCLLCYLISHDQHQHCSSEPTVISAHIKMRNFSEYQAVSALAKKNTVWLLQKQIKWTSTALLSVSLSIHTERHRLRLN